VLNLLNHNLLLGAMPSWRRHSTSEHTSQTADLLVVCLPQVRTEHLAHAERIGVFSLSVSAKDGCHRSGTEGLRTRLPLYAAWSCPTARGAGAQGTRHGAV